MVVVLFGNGPLTHCSPPLLNFSGFLAPLSEMAVLSINNGLFLQMSILSDYFLPMVSCWLRDLFSFWPTLLSPS